MAAGSTPSSESTGGASSAPAIPLAEASGGTRPAGGARPARTFRQRWLSLKPLLTLLGLVLLLGLLFSRPELPVPRERLWGSWEIRSVDDSLIRRWVFEPDGTLRYETLESSEARLGSRWHHMTSRRRGRYRFLDDYTFELEWSDGDSELWSYSILPWQVLELTGPLGETEVYQPTLNEPNYAPR